MAIAGFVCRRRRVSTALQYLLWLRGLQYAVLVKGTGSGARLLSSSRDPALTSSVALESELAFLGLFS